jgi:hypothetical protein
LKPAKSIATPVTKSGLPCPACGAMLVVGPALRRKKVQCPKCREIILLPDAPADTEAAAAEPEPSASDETRTPASAPQVISEERATRIEGRLDALEGALALLQRTLLQLTREQEKPSRPAAEKDPVEYRETPALPLTSAPAPPTSEDFPPHFKDWRSMARSSNAEPDELASAAPAIASPADEHRAAPAPAPSQNFPDEALVHVLAEFPSGKISLTPTSDDAATLAFTQRLQQLFNSAGWKVLRPDSGPAKRERDKITLVTTAHLPSPKIASTIHRAFSEAALPLAFEIDPGGTSPIPLLLIPRQEAQLPRTEPLAEPAARPSLSTLPPAHTAENAHATDATKDFSIFRPRPLPAQIAS